MFIQKSKYWYFQKNLIFFINFEIFIKYPFLFSIWRCARKFHFSKFLDFPGGFLGYAILQLCFQFMQLVRRWADSWRRLSYLSFTETQLHAPISTIIIIPLKRLASLELILMPFTRATATCQTGFSCKSAKFGLFFF